MASGDLRAIALAPTACDSFCGILKGAGEMASAPLPHNFAPVLAVFSLKVPSRKCTYTTGSGNRLLCRAVAWQGHVTVSHEGRSYAGSLGLVQFGGDCLTQERWHLWVVMGEGLSTGTLLAVTSALSPEPYNPICPYMTPVCFSPPFLCQSQG